MRGFPKKTGTPSSIRFRKKQVHLRRDNECIGNTTAGTNVLQLCLAHLSMQQPYSKEDKLLVPYSGSLT